MRSLDKAQYVLLGTRKKDGSIVDTPVWFAKQGATVYMFSAREAGKVKRLRNFSEARLAPCTVSGKKLGDYVPAEAHLLSDDADIREAHKALIKKYGWQMRLLDMGARLGRRYNKRAFIKAEIA